MAAPECALFRRSLRRPAAAPAEEGSCPSLSLRPLVRRPGAGSRGTHKGARGRGLCPLKAAPGRAAAAWPTGRAGFHDPGLSLGSRASCLRAAGPREGGRAGPPPAAAAGGHTCHLGRGGDRGRERLALPGPGGVRLLPPALIRGVFRALESIRNNRPRCQRAACLPSRALVLSFRKSCP